MTLLDFKIYYKVMVSRQCGTGKRRNKQVNETEQSTQKQTHINTFNSSLTKEKGNKMKQCLFNKWGWNNWIFIWKKMNLESDPTSFIKINSTRVINLNVKYKIKNYQALREDTIGEKLDIHGYSGDFFF